VPRLWDDSIDAHRRAVRDATLDATAALVSEHGLRGVTMSQIAESTGIARATLYKYFPDVAAILLAWHERQIAGHLEHLAGVRDRAVGAGARLRAVLEAYALLSARARGHGDADLAALLHGDGRLAGAERQVLDMVRELVADAVAAGEVRADVPPDELAAYCVHALTGARAAPSKAAVRRLVELTLAGLRAPA
jgi:AcrR family transcriptional regulator